MICQFEANVTVLTLHGATKLLSLYNVIE